MKKIITLFLIIAFGSLQAQTQKRIRDFDLEISLENSSSLLIDAPSYTNFKRIDLLGLKNWLYNGLSAFETDPLFAAWNKSTGISITKSQVSDFGSYQPFDNALETLANFTAGGKLVLTTAGDFGLIDNNSSDWNTAFSWGNHASAGYLTSYTETDPVFSNWDKSTGISITKSQVSDFGTYQPYDGALETLANFTAGGKLVLTTAGDFGLVDNNSSNWNTAFSWGNHANAGYLTSYTETDPVFNAWDRSTGISISESQISDLGNYLTSYSETDPNFAAWNKSTGITITKSQVSDFGSYQPFDNALETLANFTAGGKLVLTTAGDFGLIDNNSSNWNTAYSWGNHANAGYLTSYTETDPVFNAWNKSTGITITKNQVSDFGNYQPVINTNGDYTFGSLNINDPGANEGISWKGGNLWKIYESPDALTNAAGNLQIVQNTTRRLTIGTDGKVTALGTLYEGSNRVLTSETDPVFSSWNKSTGITITKNQVSDFGNYQPYDGALETLANFTTGGKLVLTTAGDFGLIDNNSTNWNTAYSWGNHASAGYLKSYTETDPSFAAWNKSTGITITKSQVSDFGTYLTSYTETDPAFSAWNKSTGITITKSQVSDFGSYQPYDGALETLANFTAGGKLVLTTAGDFGLIDNNSTNWNTAYGWGNHASAGYLKSYTETDPSFSAWNKSSGITISKSQVSDFGSYLTAMPSNVTYDNIDESIGGKWAFSNAIREQGSLLASKYAGISHNHDGTYLKSYTETDPIFSAWNKSSGITITKSQVSDFGNYLTSYTETDPVFSAWNKDAATVDGYNTSSGTTVNTIAVRNSSGDIYARLFRSTYGEQSTAPASTADIAFRNSTSDNYIRFMTQSALKSWLGLTQSLTTTSNVTFSNVTGAQFYGTNFTLTSDRRLKENIKPLSPQLAYKLNPITHTWINGDSLAINVGFIADEVKKVNAELVSMRPDGFEGVTYSKITAINNAAIQDLDKRLTSLESKLDTLLNLLK